MSSNKLTFTEEEAEVGLMRLDTYDIESPVDFGTHKCFLHKYSDTEKDILKSAFAIHFDEWMPCFSVCQPSGRRVAALDELIKYMIESRDGSLDSIISVSQKSKDYILDLFVDLITEGCIVLTPNKRK